MKIVIVRETQNSYTLNLNVQNRTATCETHLRVELQFDNGLQDTKTIRNKSSSKCIQRSILRWTKIVMMC